MTEYFYRYRKAKAVLAEFEELDRQEIYFSTTEELNDPMEGFKDLFWQGDEIAWRNLMKHYILCVLQTANYCFLAGDQFDPKVLENIVFWVPQELPQAPMGEVHQRIETTFLAEPAVQKLITTLGARTKPVRRYELTAYIRSLHGFALFIVLGELRAHGLLPPPSTADVTERPSPEKLRRDAMAVMEGVQQIKDGEYPAERITEALFTASASSNDQMILINEINMPEREKQRPILYLTHRMPANYVAALDRLVHEDWYVACFAKSPTNHSMWSMYADGHRGVALKFQTTLGSDGLPAMPINRIVSAGGDRSGKITYGREFRPLPLQQVIYSNQYPSIDFFRSLGRIREMHLNNFWYRGDGNIFSTCRDAVYADHDGWRKAYWHTFGQSALFKTPEWAHEEEYRMVLHSGFDLREKSDRKLQFRFEDLTGIVFGARTNMDDKLAIMRIVDKKCGETKRSDFEFSEIRYLPSESRFQLFELSLLTPKQPT
jgi:hypothetical protein